MNGFLADQAGGVDSSSTCHDSRIQDTASAACAQNVAGSSMLALKHPDIRPISALFDVDECLNMLYCRVFRRPRLDGSGHERSGSIGMYPYSREVNGAFRPSPSATGHQSRSGLLAQMEPVDDHDGSIRSVNGEMRARGTADLSMNAAIDRVPKQSLNTAVELDASAATVEPATNNPVTGPSVGGPLSAMKGLWTPLAALALA